MASTLAERAYRVYGGTIVRLEKRENDHVVDGDEDADDDGLRIDEKDEKR